MGAVVSRESTTLSPLVSVYASTGISNAGRASGGRKRLAAASAPGAGVGVCTGVAAAVDGGRSCLGGGGEWAQARASATDSQQSFFMAPRGYSATPRATRVVLPTAVLQSGSARAGGHLDGHRCVLRRRSTTGRAVPSRCPEVRRSPRCWSSPRCCSPAWGAPRAGPTRTRASTSRPGARCTTEATGSRPPSTAVPTSPSRRCSTGQWALASRCSGRRSSRRRLPVALAALALAWVTGRLARREVGARGRARRHPPARHLPRAAALRAGGPDGRAAGAGHRGRAGRALARGLGRSPGARAGRQGWPRPRRRCSRGRSARCSWWRPAAVYLGRRGDAPVHGCRGCSARWRWRSCSPRPGTWRWRSSHGAAVRVALLRDRERGEVPLPLDARGRAGAPRRAPGAAAALDAARAPARPCRRAGLAVGAGRPPRCTACRG